MSVQPAYVPIRSLSIFYPTYCPRVYDGPIDHSKVYVVSAVGVYIAIASSYFAVVFGADVFNRFFEDKPWYPNRFISLNAISLTALSIAIKIPIDLTTTMKTPEEQFSKLTGSSLACILIANTMPSLGDMEGKCTIMSNVFALGILIVDLWIQIKTSIIHLFWRQQIVVMVIMFLQLLFVISTALVVPTTKELMERQFKTKHNPQSQVMFVDGENYLGKIKENLINYWIMAYTSNPQFVVARSPTCIASDGLCLVTTTIIIVTFVSNAFLRDLDCFANVLESDYHPIVLVAIVTFQMLAIITGTIGPASRCMWWSEVVFRNCSFRKNWKESIKNIIINDDCFKVEAYWVSSLVKRKDAPLCMNLKGTLTKKIIRFFKWFVLTLLVKMQMVIVFVSKLIRAVSVVPMFLVHKILQLIFHKILQLIFHRNFCLPASICIVIFLVITKHLTMLIYLFLFLYIFLIRSYLVHKKKFQFFRYRIMDEHQHSISSNYVLHLEGETGLGSFITKHSFNNGRRDRTWQEKEKNAKLIKLIENHSTFMEGFRFVTAFRANTRSSSHPDLLRCSWALPLVTISCIAVTLPRVDRRQVQLLLEAVSRGFTFVRLIEKSIDDSLLINMREAAKFVWVGIDFDKKWLDFDLRTKVRDAREVVEDLSRIATNHISEFKERAEEDAWNRPYEWPPMVLAADCMHTVCATILQSYDQYETKGKLFQWLQRIISDILGACLTNLPEVIHMECSKKSIEVREEGVLKAANLFLGTEDILEILYGDPVVASKFSERKKHIEEWQSRDVIVATDISAMEDLSLHPEPSSATTQQLEHVVIEVDTASEHISDVQRI